MKHTLITDNTCRTRKCIACEKIFYIDQMMNDPSLEAVWEGEDCPNGSPGSSTDVPLAIVLPMAVRNAKANFNDAASFFQWLASEATTKPELFSHVIVGYAAAASLPIFLDYSAVGDTSITSALGFLEACKQDVWEQAANL